MYYHVRYNLQTPQRYLQNKIISFVHPNSLIWQVSREVCLAKGKWKSRIIHLRVWLAGFSGNWECLEILGSFLQEKSFSLYFRKKTLSQGGGLKAPSFQKAWSLTWCNSSVLAELCTAVLS
jgi:hypothetical protein